MRLEVTKQAFHKKILHWSIGTLLVVGIVGGGSFIFVRVYHPNEAKGQERHPVPERSAAIQVEFTHPQKSSADRTIMLPGSLQAFESVQLYAGVSGYLQSQTV